MTNIQNRFFNRNSLNSISKWWLDIDKVNFLLIIGIIIFGLIITATASPAIAQKIDVNKFFFVKKQLTFAILAFFILIFISFFQHEYIKILALFGIFSAILMLIAVLFVGFEIKGARRWLSFSGFVVQPSEFAKTFFVIANAYVLQKFHENNFALRYGISAALFFVVAGLLILQPDFGMTMTLAILWASQLFIYGLPMILVVICAVFAIIGAIAAYLFLPHVEDRINRFLDLDSKNYQVERSLDAFVNGGFLGTGQGNGVVKQYIPDAHTDFVFAVIGEEFGILTCALLLLVFAYFITRIVKRALDEENMFVYLSLFGLMMQFTMQVIINIGVSLRLFPTKGMTLPFISYGGSSMISMAICFGLILAFTKKKYHRDVDYGNLKMI
jgi:cell division protein FtsW